MDTIKSSDEISTLFQQGKRLNTADLTLIVLKSERQHDHQGRVAFIAGKKLGNAVWRNRAKRRMRALCKEVKGPFPGYDVVFLAKRQINDVPYRDVEKRLREALQKMKMV